MENRDIKLNLEKDAHLLTGQERARLIIKDAHNKDYGGKGLLTKKQINALSTFEDEKALQEYDYYCGIYFDVPVLMGATTETYLLFSLYYEILKKAHLLLILAPAVRYLSETIKNNIPDDNSEKQKALDVINTIETAKIDPEQTIAFSENILYIKIIVPIIYERACSFFAMRQIIERVNNVLGFNVFAGRKYEKTYQNYIKEVDFYIKEHNRIIENSGIEELKYYIIPALTRNKKIYKEWSERIFGSRNA